MRSLNEVSRIFTGLPVEVFCDNIIRAQMKLSVYNCNINLRLGFREFQNALQKITSYACIGVHTKLISVHTGAVHKVRHARGVSGIGEGVTVCDWGRGSGACDVTLITYFIIHMKHEI